MSTDIVKKDMPWCCAFHVLGDFGFSEDSSRDDEYVPIDILSEMNVIVNSWAMKRNFTFTLTEDQYCVYKSKLNKVEIKPVFVGRNNSDDYNIYLFAEERDQVKDKLKSALRG